jgi:hypothetical protein
MATAKRGTALKKEKVVPAHSIKTNVRSTSILHSFLISVLDGGTWPALLQGKKLIRNM